MAELASRARDERVASEANAMLESEPLSFTFSYECASFFASNNARRQVPTIIAAAVHTIHPWTFPIGPSKLLERQYDCCLYCDIRNLGVKRSDALTDLL